MADPSGMGEQVTTGLKTGIQIFPIIVVVVALFFSFGTFMTFAIFFLIIAPILQPYSNRRRVQINRRKRRKR